MRTLIVIPIIHTEKDMGSLLHQIKREYVQRFGHEKWLEHLKSIDQLWTGILQMLTLLELPYPSVRLYQDGLPVCGKESEIVQDVASQGSINHQLLNELMKRGSKLEGTEDAKLLLQEYQFHQSALRDAPTGPSHERAELSKRLLMERDQFIAHRINTTLLIGEIGLSFLGLAHTIEPLLQADILVQHLLPSLKEKSGQVDV